MDDFLPYNHLDRTAYHDLPVAAGRETTKEPNNMIIFDYLLESHGEMYQR